MDSIISTVRYFMNNEALSGNESPLTELLNALRECCGRDQLPETIAQLITERVKMAVSADLTNEGMADAKLIVCRFGLTIAALSAASGDAPKSNEIEAVSEYVSCMLPARCDCEALLNEKNVSSLIELTRDQGTKNAAYLCKRVLAAREERKSVSRIKAYAHSADASLTKVLDKPLIYAAFKKYVDISQNLANGSMLAASITVSEKNFPEINAIVEDCVRALNIRRPHVVVTAEINQLNAFTFGDEQNSHIILTSLLVSAMSLDELKFVIGHECGHIAMGHLIYHSAAVFLCEKLLQFTTPFMGVIPARLAVLGVSQALYAWERRSEITADRAGLVCCRDPHLAQKALIHLECQFLPVDKIDIDDYLTNSAAYLGGGTLRKIGEYTANHPLIPKRVKALRLFAASRKYARAIDTSAEAEAVADEMLDRETDRIIKIL